MGEIKGTTFRINENTTAKFKELATSLNMTQAEFFDSLINTYEVESAKLGLADRKKEIEEFQSHTQRIVAIFLNSLELNQNAEERIRGDFLKKLQSKEELISNLQIQLKQSEENNKFKDSQFKMLSDKSHELETTNKQLNDIAVAKDNLTTEYVEKIDTLSSVVTEYKHFKEENDIIKKDIAKINNELTNKEYLVKNLELEKINLHKQVIMLETNTKEYKESLLTERADHKEEINIIKKENNEVIKSLEQNLEDKKLKIQKEFHDKLDMEKQKMEIQLSKIELEKDKLIEKLNKELSGLQSQIPTKR